MEESHRLFCVVGTARASFLIKTEECITLNAQPNGNQQAVQFNFQTRLIESGFETPIPQGLKMEARGKGIDLKSVTEDFINRANDLVGILAVSSNAYIPPLEAELSYDDTPGITDHEYFQCLVKDEPPMVVPNRTLDCDLTVSLFEAVGRCAHQARLMRAIGQYSVALGHWRPGAEMMCVAHCFMGIEALKPVALEVHRSKTGLSDEDIARQWDFDPNRRQKIQEFLEVNARERLLFMNDAECRKGAKKVSDDFEHGFSNFSVLHPIAQEVLVPTARYLRNAIINLSGIEDSKGTALRDGYSEPRGPIKIIKYLWGRLNGPGGSLAAQGQEYPHLRWDSKLIRVLRDNDGKISTQHSDNITPVIGPNVTFSLKRSEVWDGSIVRQAPPPETT